ncbi:MAG: NAD(P)H-dependent oxidoreductase [Pirellulales bacterium]|nr:NAD(P)H-dependent oxidoreductase [Thermoguttaceae bacterium]MDD4785568.1 NAD(P)H-dependent oxidoreductase [Pirellulales bacterium]MDI9445392.1 NAD(P)H-dependent oxidoreductase [Planctomycetota bacterium]NLZ00617.1 NAD(P)H-dependent oxidoreductase [Pirellulaceae bacterium]
MLFAAPVFCSGFPAQIKSLLDRMFCLMDTAGEQPAAPWRPGKPIGLLLTGAGDEADNADLVIRGLEQLTQWVQGRMMGHWFVGGCTEPEALGGDVESRATQFAAALAPEVARLEACGQYEPGRYPPV